MTNCERAVIEKNVQLKPNPDQRKATEEETFKLHLEERLRICWRWGEGRGKIKESVKVNDMVLE